MTVSDHLTNDEFYEGQLIKLELQALASGPLLSKTRSTDFGVPATRSSFLALFVHTLARLSIGDER